MEMKWHPIVNGDMSRVPRDEELIFTVFDEEDGETYVTSRQVKHACTPTKVGDTAN